jgi:hypothetical protein
MATKYGLWTAVGEAPRRGARNDKALRCVCACGVERDVLLHNLANGTSTSCGCDKDRKTAERSRTHGHSRTPIYRAWKGMLERCEKPSHKSYAYYGGRGITVCKRWHSFENFLADMGARPDGMSLERRDNNKGYTPSNCYWATRAAQMANTRNSLMLEVRGTRKHAREWAASIGITQRGLAARIAHGWTVEDACTTPHQRKQKGD